MPHLCVIPARLGSNRLPSKPLRLLNGDPLIAVVAQRVSDLGIADTVVVATDDERIVDAVAPTGVEAIMTRRDHRNGTERVAEVAKLTRFEHAEVVINVQGDEPFISREAVAGAVGRVLSGDALGTAAMPLARRDVFDRNIVKAVVDEAGYALRFCRDVPASVPLSCRPSVFHHLGVYAYRRSALLHWARLPATLGEIEERLEQLRPLSHGYRIGVAVVPSMTFSGIDTEEELQRAQSSARRLAERVA
ncbi:MAG: 3-deoxy-manno-octulosonate cytidylyltransferase [Gemmatimonadales bacterium]